MKEQQYSKLWLTCTKLSKKVCFPRFWINFSKDEDIFYKPFKSLIFCSKIFFWNKYQYKVLYSLIFIRCTLPPPPPGGICKDQVFLRIGNNVGKELQQDTQNIPCPIEIIHKEFQEIITNNFKMPVFWPHPLLWVSYNIVFYN